MKSAMSARFWAVWVMLCGVSFVSQAAITIFSVNATPSTCANDGSISVFASSSLPNPSLLYAIVAGPVTTPIQNNNTFFSLYPGTYTIRLYDANFDSTETQATVTGNYQLPDLNPQHKDPVCQGTTDGTIVGHADSTKGLLPFYWEIIYPNYFGPQPLDTFNNLSGGTYEIRMTDACNNFQTRTVVLNGQGTGLGPFGFAVPSVEIIGCDTVIVSFPITLYKEAAYMPLNMRAINNSNTYTSQVYATPLDTVNYVPGLYEVRDTFVGITYGSHLHLTVSDTCQMSVYGQYQTVAPFDFYYDYYTPGTGCGNQMSAVARIKSHPFYSYYYTSMKPPVILTVTDIATNTVVDRDTCTQYCSSMNIEPLLGGRTYRIHIVDGCGTVYQQNIVWPVPAAVSCQVSSSQGCMDSTAVAYFNCFNFRTATTITIVSGPTSVHSSKPGYEHSSTITYPQVYTGMRPGGIALRDLPAGTYTYTVADSCGNSVNGSFTIPTSDLADFHYTYTIKRGCLGANTLYFNAYSQAAALLLVDSLGQYVYQRLNYQQGLDSVNSVPPGTYVLNIFYGNSPFGGGVFDTTITGAPTCWVVRDTLTVYPYSNNTFQSNTTIFCNGLTYVELNVDSTKGIPPYMYEISGGPQTFPLQTSNTFQISTLGTYTIRIRDVCGNSQTQQITIDSDTFPTVIKKGIMCLNSRLVLAGVASAYFDYEWERPNGTIHAGDSLIIDPLTVADTGWYQLTQYVHINGCTDTFTNHYRVTLTDSFPQSVSICQGDTLFVGPTPYTVAGHYVDTLASLMGCDSIIITDLTVLNQNTTINDTTICVGEQITVNGHIYTQPGTYRDSISSGACYQIIITNLGVGGTIDTISPTLCFGDTLFIGNHAYTANGTYHDTLLSSIGCDSIVVSMPIYMYATSANVYTLCPGDSVVVAGHGYYTSGVQYDTIPSASGCDSFIISIINVLQLGRDTINAQICAGDSYPFGGNTYTATGTYYDTVATGGCDSIVMLNLVVGTYLHDTITAGVCPGGTFLFHGNTYGIPGTYSDTVIAAGCDTIVTLELIGLDFMRDTTNQTICPGGSYFFHGNAYNLPGTYYDTVSVGAMCDLVSMLNLSVSPYLYDTLSASICPGGSYQFYGNTLNAAGTYVDTVAGTGCDSIITLHLNALPYGRDTISATVCFGQSYILGGHAYTQSGTYTDTVVGTGCDSIITLRLAVYAVAVADTVDQTICVGESFIFGGQTLQLAGTYTDTARNANGCDSITVLRLAVESSPNIQIIANATEVYAGDTVLLNTTAITVLSYYWTSSEPLINPTSQTPMAVITAPAWITMTAWDGNNCPVSDSIFINILPDTTGCNGNTYVYIPNVFSPNNDGQNDEFVIFHKGIELIELKIFNRWGELVYRTQNIDKYWDGTYKGNTLPPDVYVYYLNYLPCDGKYELYKEGSITLIK